MSAISGLTSVSIAAVATAPSWVSGLSLNAWASLSNVNFLSNVVASDIGQYGTTEPAAVISTWGGAALATGFGDHGSIIHWNGGHTDYWGNEVYSFDLSTLTWTRLNDPSAGPFPPNEADGLFSDNKPCVPHTYHFVGYRPTNNSFYTTRRAISDDGGGSYFAPSFFNLDTEVWTNYGLSALTGLAYNNSTQCYDSTRDAIWQVKAYSGFDLAKFDCVNETWAEYTAQSGNFAELIALHIPTKDCVLMFVDDGILRGFDPASPNTDPVTITTTGTGPTLANNRSANWSSVLGKVVYVPTGSDDVYTLTPPAGSWSSGTWTWSQLSVTGTVDPGSSGYYNKCSVAEWGSYVAIILNCLYSGNCQVLRLA